MFAFQDKDLQARYEMYYRHVQQHLRTLDKKKNSLSSKMQIISNNNDD